MCIENMQAEYKTVPLVLAGKATPTTSENPPPLSPPMIQGDEGLDTNGVLTEEATDSTAQAKDEPTEDGGDSSGYEAKIATQVRATLYIQCVDQIMLSVIFSCTLNLTQVETVDSFVCVHVV